MEEDTSVSEFEIFKDAMREENLEVQIEITKRLGTLARHLGEEATRNELLPFIRQNIDYHDEILLNLSEQLKLFIPLVGGYQHSGPVLDVLMKLCNTDETIVRDKTVETLKTIAENLNSELTEELFLPVLEALATADWFTSKCSAACLYSTIYSKVKEEKKMELRNSFRVLIQDDSPIVRKTAAISLIDFINCMELQYVKDEFIAVFDNVAKDTIDSVRVFAVDIAVALAKRLTENEIEEFVFSTVEDWADDFSWRLRQRLAHNIGEVQRVIPFGKTRGKILAMFQKLVKDLEGEVRVVAAKNLFNYCDSLRETYKSQPQYEDNFEPVFLQSIMPQIKFLLTDPVDEVRMAVSASLLALSSILREECFKSNVLPLLIDVLEHEASMPIQENMLQNLNSLPTNVDLTLSLHSIKNVVRSLIINSQSHWRTRRSIFVAFMHIARFSTKEYFAENLKILYAALLGDPIFAIRRTAPIILPLLAKHYGIKWTSDNVIPYFIMFTKDCRYLYRFVPLFCINELIFPSLDIDPCNGENDDKYLKDLKELVSCVDSKTRRRAQRLLVKILKIFEKLNRRLEESKFQDMLKLNDSIDDFKNDNIQLYAGETMEVLCSDENRNIFSITEETVLNEEWMYLEGLLILIYTEFLPTILKLSKDITENVQIRSIFTLNKIREFLDRLGRELRQSWVRKSTKELNFEDIAIIEKEVDAEISKKVLDVEEEKVNTDLMESIVISSTEVLPDLGNIPELEISTESSGENRDQVPETVTTKEKEKLNAPEVELVKVKEGELQTKEKAEEIATKIDTKDKEEYKPEAS